MPRKIFTMEDIKVLAQKLEVNWSDVKFTEKDLLKGIHVELEHGTENPATDITGDDPIMTAKIALAHLNEFPDYYERLEKMETEAKIYWDKVKAEEEMAVDSEDPADSEAPPEGHIVFLLESTKTAKDYFASLESGKVEKYWASLGATEEERFVKCVDKFKKAGIDAAIVYATAVAKIATKGMFSLKSHLTEGKEPPVCDKCGKKHWPFQKCGDIGKKKEEEKKKQKVTEGKARPGVPDGTGSAQGKAGRGAGPGGGKNKEKGCNPPKKEKKKSCDTKGDKIRSKGKGQGKGYGDGEGPIGIPAGEKELKKEINALLKEVTDLIIDLE